MSQMSQLDQKCKDAMVAFINKGDMSYDNVHGYLRTFAMVFRVSYAQASRYLDDVLGEVS